LPDAPRNIDVEKNGAIGNLLRSKELNYVSLLSKFRQFFLKHPRRSGGRASNSIFPPYAQGSSDQIKISSYIELNIHTSKVEAIMYFEIRTGPPSWLHKIECSILKH
jgi:hypothetical protein